jgi:hypothetical protein
VRGHAFVVAQLEAVFVDNVGAVDGRVKISVGVEGDANCADVCLVLFELLGISEVLRHFLIFLELLGILRSF